LVTVMVRPSSSSGALDDDLGGEDDVAVVPIVVVEGLGLDLAVGVVDVLAPGEQVGAADVEDGRVWATWPSGRERNSMS